MRTSGVYFESVQRDEATLLEILTFRERFFFCFEQPRGVVRLLARVHCLNSWKREDVNTRIYFTFFFILVILSDVRLIIHLVGCII